MKAEHTIALGLAVFAFPFAVGMVCEWWRSR